MVQVIVNEGILQGEVIQNKYGGQYYSFKGIPYAQPPLGELRFKAPLPPKSWTGIRSAKKFGPQCLQYDWFKGKDDKEGSEDCLYLNIYTPDVKSDQLLPVMFWIHGGAYVCGSGDDELYSPNFLVKEGVVVVTINYRLEVLGFLCLETEDIPGNAGMKDQVQALRWVNKNITKFGGDPNNVTIFGESAGASSVSYHLISPMSKGLFKRAIAQSGACLCNWAQSYNPRDRALGLARKLGLYSDNNKELYEFFKNQPAEALVKVPIPIALFEHSLMDKTDVYYSIVDEKKFGDSERFFYGDLIDAVSNNIHDGVDIMTGFNSDEGLMMIKSRDYLKQHMNIARDFPEYFVGKPLSFTLPLTQQLELGKKICKFYFSNPMKIPEDWPQLVKFYSMYMIYFGVMQWVKYCAKANRNKIYLYNFSCKSERNITNDIIGIADVIGKEAVTNHFDELMYLFDAKVLSANVDTNSSTFQLINKVTKLWTNFAKFGNPTPDDTFGVKWLPYTLEDQDYMDIGNDMVSGKAPLQKELQFWENEYKEYGHRVIQ